MERTKLEADKAQIEHAIAMSIAVEEEKKKIKLQEELEFEQALKESEQEYQRQQDKLKLGQNPEKTQVPIQPTEKPIQKLEKIQENIQTPIEKLEKTPEKTVENQTFLLTDSHCQKIGSTLDEKKSESSVENKNPKVEEEQKEFVNLKNASKKTVEDDVPLFQSKQNVSKQQSVVKKESHLVELPPLKADLKYDPLSLNELLKEKQSLAAKLDALKAKPNSSIIDELKAGEVSKISTKDEGEGFLERKKRLEKQRELILKKKKEEREKELKEYKEVV